VALLPIRPFTCEQAAEVWKMPEVEARKVLEELASRAILLDVQGREGRQFFVLPPPMAGFFEFSLMRVRGDVDGVGQRPPTPQAAPCPAGREYLFGLRRLCSQLQP
jgi:hypothetical protein